ncbi:MAG: cryptochrome/photolyase family protein [Flavobacteriaceae bacterium]|nr:MAG: deoxyribodipyrimidine photo-lyase [Bacteroidota bacterium]|tara:strand:- start:2426 stop:3724 length:1299 start_codon:yes stop_codon:yes gene_type:complete
MNKINIFWFRRDLRLYDNHGLSKATHDNLKVIPIFIFDTTITSLLASNDRRINFIYDNLLEIDSELNKKYKSNLNVFQGKPYDIFKNLMENYSIKNVYTNNDYEPYAINRDESIKELLSYNGINFKSYKDQVIFEKNEIVKDDGNPYVVYTPFMKKWKTKLNEDITLLDEKKILNNFYQEAISNLLKLSDYGFVENESKIEAFKLNKEIVINYAERRNFPYLNSTSKIGPYLRFGSVSIRKIVSGLLRGFKEDTFLKELIWREFFMQILYHFPHTAKDSFKSKYDKIVWLNEEKAFESWKNGNTGYPLIDAGMNELNLTGFMHNRVRMITASFLCKHLLIDWRWGEKYFAEKLNDYEMASNVGNWQWASGSGVDAAPYFRIFNPHTQILKFDNKREYINKWVDVNSSDYPNEIIEHKFARDRCLNTYKKYLD